MKLYFPFFLAVIALAQTASSRLSGSVTQVNPEANQITLKTAQGDLAFTATERTQIVRAQPGVTDPKQWPKMTLSQIASGDEVLAYFRGAADQKPLVATSLVVRTKADLGQAAQKQLEDWKKRGISGTAAAVDTAAQTITLKLGARTVTAHAGDKTEFRRYSPDSAKPADAKPSSLAEIKPGDQVNVLGNRGDDGATVAAEVVYFGTFRQLAALINSIDPATGEMKVTDLATKKPLVIRVASDTTMKKLPEQMAQMLARRYHVGRGAEGEAQAPPPGRGGGRGGDIGQMLERLPAIQLADLKPKDAVMVSTTQGSDPGKVAAVMLLAGVEPILTAAPSATRDIMSGWNLGGGEGEGQ
jgi:Cu/Ag efflux protein CusF